jgi:hypothetical protein
MHVCVESELPVPTRAMAEGPDLKVRERYCCGLDEYRCSNEALCSIREGKSGCYEDGPCLTDIAYLGCSAVADAVLDNNAARKALCDSSGGRWSTDGRVADRRCHCYSPPDPDGGPDQLGMMSRAGCTTLRQACTSGGGRWAPPKAPRRGVANYVRDPDQCVRSTTGSTSTWNPSGTHWDGTKGICEMLMDAPVCHFNGRELQMTADILALVPAPKSR